MQIIPFDQTAQGLKDISYSKELAYIKNGMHHHLGTQLTKFITGNNLSLTSKLKDK